MHLPYYNVLSGYTIPDVKEKQGGVCAHITSLAQVEVILTQYCPHVIPIMKRLEKLASKGKLRPLHQVCPRDEGRPCAAKYSVDDHWYRAEVLGVEQGRIVVGFVDFGDMETLSPECVKEIPLDLLILPRASISCMITGLDLEDIGEENWSRARAWLVDKVSDKVVKMEVSNFVRDQVACEAKLYADDDETDVASQLKKVLSERQFVGIDR